MDFAYILLGMSTLWIFLYKREWLLARRTFFYLLAWNIVLFVMGYVLDEIQTGETKMAVALKLSLLCQLIFIIAVSIFRKIYNRNPEDTFWTMDVSLMKDGVFNFFFWLLAVVVPTILVFMRIV